MSAIFAPDLLAWLDQQMTDARRAVRESAGPLFTVSAVARLVALGQVRQELTGDRA